MTVKENYIRAISFTYPDHVPYEPVVQWLRYEGDMMWMGESGFDPWGVGWESVLDDFVPMPKVNPLKDWDKVETFPMPDPADFRLREDARYLLKTANREEILLFALQPHLFLERGCYLAGMERMLEALVSEPEATQILLHRLADYQAGIAQRFLEEVPDIDGVQLGDDYGSQRALMISPDVWRRAIKPHLRRIVQAYREKGKFVSLHSCGHLTEIMEDLIEVGLHIVNPVQARANDLDEWGRRFGGRIVFHGGVDTQWTLVWGTPEDVRREVRLRMRQLAGDRGGFIIAPDQHMVIPEANMLALYEEAARSGRYPISYD